jgi:hypothetical protein
MSTNIDGKGSIAMKLLILVLAVVMVMIILIPGEIWSDEEQRMDNSRMNMVTLWEAYRFYSTTHDSMSYDKADIIQALQDDSSLVLRQRIVTHTEQLRTAVDGYLELPVVKNLLAISQNIKSTKEDLINNERFFVKVPEYQQESQDLLMKLTVYESGIELGAYITAVKGLDSLYQLRRDLADYTLQDGARRSFELSARVQANLPQVDVAKIAANWAPLNARIAKFMLAVRGSELRAVTSISDRVEDFLAAINDGFTNLQKVSLQNAIQETGNASANFETIYKAFLEDFLVTGKYAQYKLSETDSLLLHISEKNFVTPAGLEYRVELRDTLGIWVEDPTLVAELSEKVMPVVEEINQMDFLNAFRTYNAQLDSLKKFYMEVKASYRKNSEVFIKTKEMDAEIANLHGTTAFEAYTDLNNFVTRVPNNTSFSDIKDMVDDGLLAVGSFRQIYGEKIFGNLDSTHATIINELNNFNDLVSGIRRNTFSFDNHIVDLEQTMGQIKAVNSAAILPGLEKAEQSLQDAYLLASDGVEETRYGIFKTKIQNEGKVYGKTARKSWED